MARAPQNAWRRHCPACDEGVINPGLWDTKRKRQRRCPACGNRIEFLVPALPYYLHAGFQALFWPAAPILVVYLAYKGGWQWGMAIVLGAFALLASVNLVFNRMLVARRADRIPADEIDYQRRFPDQPGI
jgi:uncharacterized protein (DUF983 family)